MESQIIPMTSLPTKALHKIFDELTVVDFYNVSLTCKLFNSIISQPPYMNHFKLKLSKKKINREWIGLRKNYKDMYIEGDCAHHYFNIIDQVSHSMTNLSCFADGIKVSVLRKLLEKLPNLTFIEIGVLRDDEMECNLKRDFNEPLPRYELKYFEYCGSSRNFGLFKRCQVKKLIIVREFSPYDVNFREMLLAQKNLEDLSLTNFMDPTIIFQVPMDNVKFRLKRLELHSFNGLKQKKFATFLKPHKDSLEYLEIDRYGEILRKFNEFTNLKEVKLTHCNLNGSAVLPSVKFLWVENVKSSFHKSFPNINTLWIKKCEQKYSFIKELKELRVLVLDSCEIPEIEVPQINKIVFINVKFLDQKPFNYDTTKLQTIFNERSCSKWLVNYLERPKTFLHILELEDVKIDWKLKWALDGFEKKIIRLVLKNVTYTDDDDEDETISDSEWESCSDSNEEIPQVEELTEAKEENNDFLNKIAELNQEYIKEAEESDTKSVTSIGKKKFTNYIDELILPKDLKISLDPETLSKINFNLKKFKIEEMKSDKKLTDMPEEILVKIFKEVSFKDLKSLSECCHRFLEVTSNSQFIKKYLLTVNNKAIIDGIRPYQFVNIRSLSKFFMPFFDKIGESIIDLTLEDHNLSSSIAVKIIKKCPNLKSFKVETFAMPGKCEPLEISLDNLIIIGNFEYIEVFKNVQVKNFGFNAQKISSDNRTEFVDFLLNQKNLESLYLNRKLSISIDEPANFLNDVRILDVKFRLKKLEVISFDASGMVFNNFVELHKDTLEIISVNFKSANLLNIVKDFPILKRAELNFVNPLIIPLMNNVEDLFITNCEGNIFNSFPNLKKLQIVEDFTTLKHITESNSLEELLLNNGFEQNIKKFVMPRTVKKVTLSNCDPARKVPFAMRGNNIQELNVIFCHKIDWIAKFLRHVEERKVKIYLDELTLTLKVQKALKIYKEKIQELKIVKCEYEENPDDIDVELSDDEEDGINEPGSDDENEDEIDDEVDDNWFELIEHSDDEEAMIEDFEDHDEDAWNIAMMMLGREVFGINQDFDDEFFGDDPEDFEYAEPY